MEKNNNTLTHQKLETIHFYWLDLIRFLAAFAVVVCHGRGFFLPEYSSLPPSQQNLLTFGFYAITRLGNEAVIIFFVLSGLLVGGRSLSKMLERRFCLSDYVIDRVARIMPPLFGAIVFYIICAHIYGAEVNYWHCLGNLLSLQGILVPSVVEPFWSLSYEVWFYIITGAVGCFALSPKPLWRYFSLALLACCGYFFTKLSAVYLFIWLVGAAGFFIISAKTGWLKLVVLAILNIMAIVLCQLAFTSRAFTGIPPISYNMAITIFAVTGTMGIAQLVSLVPQKMLAVRLNRGGTMLAAFSYTLYLTHIPAFRVIQHFGVERSSILTFVSLTVYILCMLAALLTAYLIYCCFEKHTKWYKAKMKTWFVKISQPTLR